MRNTFFWMTLAETVHSTNKFVDSTFKFEPESHPSSGQAWRLVSESTVEGIKISHIFIE
jgi:hypothetical protein